MKRANYLPAPHVYNLSMACMVIYDAFGHPPYLVGSSIEKRDYRDVDVRLILPDDEYKQLFPDTTHTTHNARWSIICSSISLYLSQHSGLPVDFQIQAQTKANAEFGDKPRHALGLYFVQAKENQQPSVL